MRLLIYSDMSSAPWGGSEILWSRLIPLLSQQGATVAVTAFANTRTRLICRDNGIANRLLLPPSLARAPQQILRKTLNKLSGGAIRRARQRVWFERQRRFCERFAPEVVFVSMAWPQAAWPLHPFLQKAGIPYVCFLHGIAEDWTTRRASIERQRFFQGAFRVLTTGKRSAEMLQQWLGRPLINTVPTLNFVDCDYFSPQTPGPTSPCAETVRLLSVARLSVREKGQDILLQALGPLRDLNWRLTLAGDGPDRSHLEQQATDLGIRDKTVFCGETSTAQVRQLLATHDVFVLASRSEGLPLSLLEAMAARRPCIATDVGSIQEVLIHEESGLLVPPEDPDALTQAIKRMIEDISLRQRCAAQAQTIVRRQCDAPVFLDRVAGLIEQAALDSRSNVA